VSRGRKQERTRKACCGENRQERPAGRSQRVRRARTHGPMNDRFPLSLPESGTRRGARTAECGLRKNRAQ
jgi:hypothetical protein